LTKYAFKFGALLLCVLFISIVAPGLGVAQAKSVEVLEKALFRELTELPQADAELDCGDNSTPVKLPHQWTRRPVGDMQSVSVGLYCLEVMVDTSKPVAAFLPRVLSNVEVYWDGRRIAGFGAMQVPFRDNWNRPIVFSLPSASGPRLEGPQRHMLAIVLVGYPASRVGLSRIFFGPEAEMLKIHDQRRFWQWELSLAAVMLFAFFGALILGLSYKNNARAEVILGMGLIVWAARSSYYFLTDPIEPRWLLLLIVVGMTAVVGALLSSFVIRFLNRAGTFLEKLFWWQALVLCLLCFGYGFFSSVWMYYLIVIFGFGGLLSYLYPVSLTIRQWWLVGTWQSLLIAVGFSLLFAGSTWDSAVIFGLTDFEAHYVRHFAVVPLVFGLCILYLQRYLVALKTTRYLADSLALRVAQKERELSQSYDRVLKLEVANAALQERRIFVKNVHDGVGSQLVSALALVSGGTLTQDSLAALLRSCLDDLRIVIDSLDPETTDLIELLQTLCYRMEPRFAAIDVQLVWRVDASLGIKPLGAQILLNVLRITQEAFANVFKHGAHKGNVKQ
jgi:signal transduction histidine kinase